MIERGELTGCSCGFHIDSVTVHDADGTMLDVEEALDRRDDPSLFFIAQRSTIQEISVTAMPADPGACVRACSVYALYWAVIHDGEETLHRIYCARIGTALAMTAAADVEVLRCRPPLLI
jgi:phage head maturation protease